MTKESVERNNNVPTDAKSPVNKPAGTTEPVTEQPSVFSGPSQGSSGTSTGTFGDLEVPDGVDPTAAVQG